MTKHFLTLCLLCVALSAQAGLAARIEPAFWWVGMADPHLELLVYHQNIRNCSVIIDRQGVSIVRVEKAENPNYMFLTLNLTGAKPGKFRIAFLDDDLRTVTFEYFYELKQRRPDRINPVTSQDIMYMVFPDRFVNGDTTNDHLGMRDKVNRKEPLQRHGGDIAGIESKLDYFRSLGVSALWINPLVTNDQPDQSYHGYAFTDHYNVDLRFGTNEQYAKLGDKLQMLNMKLVMDVVYNHVGNEHWFYKDPPFKSWVNQWPEFTRTTYRETTLFDPYRSKADKKRLADGWFDHHMPDLNQRNQHLARYLIQNTIWWVEYAGLDGLRIDTYVYPDGEFMKNLCADVLREFPDLCIFGETWIHGPAVQAYFTENNYKNNNQTLPAVTDFQLYYAINEALSKEAGWTDGVLKIYYTLAQDFLYKNPYSHNIFLDNHDLSRFNTVVGGNFDKFKQGLAFLLTQRGIPCLYYGTEILMTSDGPNDGFKRTDFPGGWPGDPVNKFEESGRTEQENAAWKFIQNLNWYRSQTSALQTGKMMQFVPEHDGKGKGSYVYFRYDDEKTVMLMFNFSPKESIIDLNRFEEMTKDFHSASDVLTGEKVKTSLKEKEFRMSANSVFVWELRL